MQILNREPVAGEMDPGPAAKKLFMPNSTEHEISTAHKTKMLKKKDFYMLLKSQMLYLILLILLINMKMPTIAGILTFICMIKFMLS